MSSVAMHGSFSHLVNTRQLGIKTEIAQDPAAEIRGHLPPLHAPQLPGRCQQLELSAT